MSLNKQTEAWFDFDDACFLIRELSPSDKMRFGGESNSKWPECRMTDEKREVLITMAVQDWEYVNDEYGVAIECNNEGKIAFLNEVPEFYEFVMKSLKTMTADSEKAQEVEKT